MNVSFSERSTANASNVTGWSTTRKLIGRPTPFFSLLDIDSSDLEQHASAVAMLRDGHITAIVVRRLYDVDFLRHVTERLQRHDPPFVKTWFPEKFRSWFYGRNLNLLDTDFTAYFADSRRFHEHLNELFPEPGGLGTRLLKSLSVLDGGRPYRAAPGPEPEQQYMLTTIRGHGEGGYIPPHCDNEQSLRPGLDHLQTLVGNHMYSMVLLIAKPESGGVLEVFDFRVEPGQSRLISDDSVAVRPELSDLSSVALPLNPGDMIILDSGRYLHRVTPVVGSTVRWTACSFMARALDRPAVYCWG